MQDDDALDVLFSKIRSRYSELNQNTARRKRFVDHIRSLGHWEDDPMDYPDVTPEFPEFLDIAYAVCHPNCGVQEFIVEGSTQECQRYGQSLFRTDRRKYKRA